MSSYSSVPNRSADRRWENFLKSINVQYEINMQARHRVKKSLSEQDLIDVQ